MPGEPPRACSPDEPEPTLVCGECLRERALSQFSEWELSKKNAKPKCAECLRIHRHVDWKNTRARRKQEMQSLADQRALLAQQWMNPEEK